jgi:hypothetical protein
MRAATAEHGSTLHTHAGVAALPEEAAAHVHKASCEESARAATRTTPDGSEPVAKRSGMQREHGGASSSCSSLVLPEQSHDLVARNKRVLARLDVASKELDKTLRSIGLRPVRKRKARKVSKR